MDQIKIFENPVLNKLTRTNVWVAISSYVIISICIALYGFTSVKLGIIQKLLFLAIGLVAFTLTEYLVHRFLYHSGKNFKDEKNWQYKIHGVHHVFPKVKNLLAMPIPMIVLVSSLLFFIFYALLGVYVYFFFPGFLSGYATYLFLHYKMHTTKPPKNVFKYLWRHHSLHHYSCESKAYGVSSPLWDIIFGTMPPKQQRTIREERY